MTRFWGTEWMDWRRGPLWWPAKLAWWIGWVVVANAVAAAIGVVLWVAVSLLRGHF